MTSEAPIVSWSDAEIVSQFAKTAGIDPDSLLSAAMHALAQQIRQHGTITFPLGVGNCATCPHLLRERPKDGTIIKGPWPNK